MIAAATFSRAFNTRCLVRIRCSPSARFRLLLARARAPSHLFLIYLFMLYFLSDTTSCSHFAERFSCRKARNAAE